MATAIIELIAQAIKTTLDTMVVAGDAVAVDRPLRTGLPTNPKNTLLVLYQGDPEEDESPHGCKYWIQPFAVDCYIKPSDASVTPVDTAINDLRSKVEKKLRENYTCGGYAHDLRIRAPLGFIVDEGIEGSRVNFDVMYGTLEDDPFTQA